MFFARSTGNAVLRTNICRQCQRTTQRSFTQALRPQKFTQRTTRPTVTSVRWHSAPVSNSKVYDFSKIKQISDKPSEDVVLIDVREPSEYSAGYIPTALNIPIKSQADAMFLPADEFEDRFGFEKPSADKEVVFYCKSGVRSSAAAQLAQQIGYQKVAEYRGSWLDWEKNGGEAKKP
ncbi:hypothetical protein DOTSEDRAFT_69111 [Dothistroma septosporum NZE10]|uniref:Rhodanese domain-containing protein n=1 Tax=Dothistroma septosporum (strain NZE10 / CBS 128990) TaxID=675120 RepID=N1PVQ7_DOTSN|nr:hypothetical protein DOTSEDRAFT_69111 [Dothistroma septosporum NZE10]